LSLCLLITATLGLLFNIVKNATIEEGIVILLFVGYGGAAAAMLFDLLPVTLRRFRLLSEAAALSANLRTALLGARTAPIILCYGVVCQIGTVMAVFLLAQGLGLPISASACLVIVPLAGLVTLLPISIGGWGLREGAFVAGFGLVGIEPGDAIALSVLFGLMNVAFGLIGGGVWLAFQGDDRRRAAKAGVGLHEFMRRADK
jgi:glycosyltransferase 2 family protein